MNLKFPTQCRYKTLEQQSRAIHAWQQHEGQHDRPRRLVEQASETWLMTCWSDPRSQWLE